VGSIVKEDKKSVWGVVFAVTRRDLERLGRYEGPGYERCAVDVVDRDGRQHTVLTYIAKPDDPLPQERPSKDYMSHYIRGAQYFGLPEKYVDDLKRIPTG
jgi:gamma-glutamylcyclotransferase (GGCT)/AIG2-like uncharacterized protein YtfP